MKKSIKNLGTKEIKNVVAVKGGNDPLIAISIDDERNKGKVKPFVAS